jgi:hypothetical protein
MAHQRVGWVVAPQDQSEQVWARLGWEPSVALKAETVGMAFQMLKTLQDVYDLVVLDSLAGLAPDHPEAHNIAPYVRRALYAPKVPHLIINQDRHPCPPGGMLWRCLCSPQQLELVQETPLYSHIVGTGYWLVQEESGPVVRYLDLQEADALGVEFSPVPSHWAWVCGLVPDCEGWLA